METDDDMKEIFDRVDSDGVVSVTVNDGRVFVFTLDKLRELIKVAEDAGKDKVVVFIRDSKTLN